MNKRVSSIELKLGEARDVFKILFSIFFFGVKTGSSEAPREMFLLQDQI